MINNTLKYAKANEIKVSIDLDQNQFKMTYSDDGQGFDFDENGKNKGLGLNSIESRANLLNATSHFASKKGEGVQFEMSFKL